MDCVVIERDGPVAVFRLDRPPANAIDLEFATQIEAAFASLTAADDAGAIVVTGTRDCFCAGLDLKRVPFYGPDQQRAMITTLNRMVAKLYGCPLPVVGAINGHAIAGGLILAIACDYRVGTNAPCKLGLTEGRAGIPFPAAPMAVLQAELAPQAARVLTLRARNIGPDAALAVGIFDELQPPRRVLSAAVDMAKELATIPRDAYARIKRQLRAQPLAFIEDAVARGTDPMLESWITAGAGVASAALLRGE